MSFRNYNRNNILLLEIARLPSIQQTENPRSSSSHLFHTSRAVLLWDIARETCSRVIMLSDGGLLLPEYTSPNFFFWPPARPLLYPRFRIPIPPPPW
jgi:hypothetical protein